LFLPETSHGRITLVALVLIVVSGLLPGPENGFVALSAFLALIVAWAAAIRNLRRKKRRLAVLRGLFIPIKAIFVSLIFTVLYILATQALGVLVTSGNRLGSSTPSDYAYYLVEIAAALAITVIVVWIPRRLFSIKLDIHDSRIRNMMLGLITAVASFLTVPYIIMQHFYGGELSSMHLGEVIVGTIFAVALIAPGYRSFAQSCWQHGFPGMFNLRRARRHWAEVLGELEEAVNRAEEARQLHEAAGPKA
jgi:hypothetical protein